MHRNETLSRKSLIKYLSEYFQMDVGSFESFLQTGSPALRYEYVMLPFHIEMVEWRDYLVPYLN